MPTPTAETPGIEPIASPTRRRYAAPSSAVRKAPFGGVTAIWSTPSAFHPASSETIEARLRTSSPAPTSRTTANATSAPMSTSQARPRFPVPPRPPARSAVETPLRVRRSAG